jgi:hypothetical protein
VKPLTYATETRFMSASFTSSALPLQYGSH